MSICKKSEIKVVTRNSLMLGQAFARFRRKLKLTQKELALKTGLRQAGISQLESGSNGTRFSTLFKVLPALDLELVIQKRQKSNLKLPETKKNK